MFTGDAPDKGLLPKTHTGCLDRNKQPDQNGRKPDTRQRRRQTEHAQLTVRHQVTQPPRRTPESPIKHRSQLSLRSCRVGSSGTAVDAAWGNVPVQQFLSGLSSLRQGPPAATLCGVHPQGLNTGSTAITAAARVPSWTEDSWTAAAHPHRETRRKPRRKEQPTEPQNKRPDWRPHSTLAAAHAGQGKTGDSKERGEEGQWGTVGTCVTAALSRPERAECQLGALHPGWLCSHSTCGLAVPRGHRAHGGLHLQLRLAESHSHCETWPSNSQPGGKGSVLQNQTETAQPPHPVTGQQS